MNDRASVLEGDVAEQIVCGLIFTASLSGAYHKFQRTLMECKNETWVPAVVVCLWVGCRTRAVITNY